MIETKRLVIKPIMITDVEAYYNYASIKEVADNAGFKPVSSLQIARNIVVGAIYRGDTFSIFLNNTFIGTCNIYNYSFRKISGVYTLGISLHPDYWGNKYGTEAISGLVKYCFNTKNANVLEMNAISTNIRSRKMIEHIGFKYDGTLTNYSKLYNGKIYDIATYSMTKDDFKEMNL